MGFVLFAWTFFKAIVVFSGNDREVDFTLEVKDGGYQLWRAQQGENLMFDLGSINNSIHTEAEQGAIKTLKVRSGAFNIDLLLPGEVDKTRYAN